MNSDKNKRLVYNRDALEAISLSEVMDQYPNWPRNKQYEVGLSDEKISDLIKRQIICEFKNKMMEVDGCGDDKFNYKRAKRIMDRAPIELIVNINEWIEGKPLSDIAIKGVTINEIMNQYKNRAIPFVDAIECLIYFNQSTSNDKSFCLEYFSIQ